MTQHPVARDGARRPNIVLVLCDDLGYGDVGALFQNARRRDDAALPSLHTPHLDRLAATGLVLEGLYCPAPVCAPSRASLLTGCSQGNAEVRDNAFDQALADVPTLGSVLGAAGYATAAIGKWGLAGNSDVAPGPVPRDEGPADWAGYPTRRGFDTFLGYVRHKDGHEHYPLEGPYRGPKQVWHNDTEISAALRCCYTTDLFTAYSKHWIVEQQRTDPERPFFVYLALDTPHATTELPPAPYPTGAGLSGGLQWLGTPGRMITTADGVPDSWYHPDYAEACFADGTPWPDVYRRYATVVRRIDDAVGDLAALLTDLGIADDTLVIFTSDNGPSIESYLAEDFDAEFFGSSGPFDGIKRDCWEGGVRVGAVLHGPAVVARAPGTVDSTPVQFHDLLPTVAELAGVPVPARSDGRSLVPLLAGQERPPSTIYVEYAHDSATPDAPRYAEARRRRHRGQMQLVRLGDHVGVRYDVTTADDPFEVYDVVADPGQRVDLAGTEPELQARLRRAAARARTPHPARPRPYDDVALPALLPDEPTTASTLITTGTPTPWIADLSVPPAGAGSLRERTDEVGLVELGTRCDAVAACTWVGEVEVPTTGRWTFAVDGADGVVLWVHGARVIDAAVGIGEAVGIEGAGGAGEAVGTIALEAGRHPLRVHLRAPRQPQVRLAAAT